jgi:hypothetical protein
MFFGSGSKQGSDVCDVIYKILTGATGIPYPPNGEVIDARALSGTALTCTKGSPWSESGAYVPQPSPSVILLPPGIISTPIAWVLPANTKLIGTTTAVANGTTPLETTIQPSGSFTFAAVVEFGDSTHCPSGCQGISVEHLTINGNGNNGLTVNGIENDNCGVQCYVDHVTLYQVLGTGLKVSGSNATDSGPYSNITFDVGNSAAASTENGGTEQACQGGCGTVFELSR